MGAPNPMQLMLQSMQQGQQKFNQFGRWAGDVTGLGDPSKIAPSYNIDYSGMDQDRANQMALLKQFQDMAAGNGPSLAQGQLQQATDRNISQAMALGAAQQGQGLGYASALRGIADQSAQARQQAAAQSAMIRNAEQMQGMQGAGALSGQMFGQDLSRQGLGAQAAYGYDMANANAQAQAAAGRRQFLGGVLNAAGGGLPGLLGFGQQPQAAQAPTVSEPLPLSSGGQVPGYAQGGELDSKSNDTVPAMLSPGEVVIPRSITMAPNAGELAKLFVEHVTQRRKMGPPQSDEHELVRRARKAA